MTSMNIRDAALQHCRRIGSRLIVFPPQNDLPVSQIKKGVLFVWATWSTPAKLALEALCGALSSDDAFAEVLLYIADNDTENAEQFIRSVGLNPAGAGETFWINRGEVIASESNYGHQQHDVLVQHNRTLVSLD